nr:hypothetical protein [Tanacetum cinerariifolium]
MFHRRIDVKDHSFSFNFEIELLLFDSNYCIDSVKKRSSYDKGNFTVFFYFENNKISKEGKFTNFNEHIFSYSNGASVKDSFSCWEKARISPRSQSKRAGGKNRLMKAVRSSSYVLIVPSLISSCHDRFSSTIELVSFDESQVVTFNGKFVCVSGMVIAEPGVRATTRQLSDVEEDCFFDQMELFCFVDKVFDSEYVQAQAKMDFLSFIWNANPTKVRIGKREHDEDKPKLLETTIGQAAKAVRLHDEAQALKERNTNLEKEKSDLEVKVTDLAASVKEKVTVFKNCISQLKKFQNKKIKEVNEKFDKLCVYFVDMALHLEEKFYPHLLTTIFGCRWMLTHSMELAIAKCLNSTEYLSALGTAIGKAIEKALRGIFVPLSKPFSVMALEGTEGTSGAAPDTTTALSVASISASTIPPISTDDYEIAHTEGGEGAVVHVEAEADKGADPFPDVSGAELDVPE